MGLKAIPVLLKETLFEWYADRGSRLGAALAFYTLFSLAPLLMIRPTVQRGRTRYSRPSAFSATISTMAPTEEPMSEAPSGRRTRNVLVVAEISLGVAAGVTERVRLGTSILIMPLRNPVILAKELARVLERRGLRHREWAVEWESSALDFLLDKGFSPTMGARPLKRAIQRMIEDPTAIYAVLGSISSALASLSQSLHQLGEFHDGPTRKQAWMNGDPNAGRAASYKVSWELHRAAEMVLHGLFGDL